MIHRTRLEDVRLDPSGRAQLPSGVQVARLPLVDAAHALPDGTPLFARLCYREALIAAEREGARLVAPERVEETRRVGLQLLPYTGTPTAETAIDHSIRHDANVRAQLAALKWDGAQPVCGAGKHWIAGAPAGRSRLMGWDRDGAGPGTAWWQPDAVAHNREHFDDATTTVLEWDGDFSIIRPPDSGAKLPTLRLGSPERAAVELAQRAAGALVTGAYDAATVQRVRAWQAAHGLVPDGVFGPKSWTAAGYPQPAAASNARDPRAPACVAALRDANVRWPDRRKISDGIMGDAAHQSRPSDHNQGNAVDITHDPASGCDGGLIYELVKLDPRTTYVIFSGQIWSSARASEGDRKYAGVNQHRHHVHVSVRADQREDASPWGWASP